MENLWNHLVIAFALVFVIEGLIYAGFPNGVKRMMVMASSMDSGHLRIFGFAMMGFGILWIWFLQFVF